MTLEEYLVDYASAVTKKMGDGMILKETENVPNEKTKDILKKNLECIKHGERDFRF